MTAKTLLQELETAGCQLQINGEKLQIEGPLTDELRTAIRQHKPDILAELRQRETGIDWGSMSAKVRELLAERGWCAIESKVLGEVVVWARDRKVVIPDRWRDCVVYTIAEIDALMAEPRVDEEGLRRINETKKLLRPATVQAAEAHISKKFCAVPGGTIVDKKHN